MPDIITPILHMNGTSREELLDQLWNAERAVQRAIDAVVQASPNGRDYYQEPGRLQKAQSQNLARMAQLEAVADSLIAEAIQEQYPLR